MVSRKRLKIMSRSNPFLGQPLRVEVLLVTGKGITSLPVSKASILHGINNQRLNLDAKLFHEEEKEIAIQTIKGTMYGF